MPGSSETDGLRFADILTLASTVASYLGSSDVSAEHMRQGIAILEGQRKLEDLGRGRSPLVRVAPAQYGGVEPAVRALVQRWFERLGSDADARLSTAEVADLIRDLDNLDGGLAGSDADGDPQSG